MSFWLLHLMVSAIPAQAGEADTEDKTRVPRVKLIAPAVGSENVDPNLKEIRVVFDMPMSRDGYSFTGGGPSFPQPTGSPLWVDAYTCVLPVRLKSNKEYTFGINSATHQSFRSVWLVPAAPVSCRFKTGGLSVVRRDPEGQRKINLESFDELCDALRTRYSYLDLQGVDWEEHFAAHRQDIVQAESDAEWARKTAEMLAIASDLHLWLKFDGEQYPTARRSVRPNGSLVSVAVTIGAVTALGRSVGTTVTEDGIAYVLISSWSSKIAAEMEHVHSFLEKHRDAPGVIIDVRQNSGGNETLARQVAGWFVDEPAIYAKHAFRRGPSPEDFTPARDRVIEPNKPEWRYAGPVAVLMGPTNMSSSEAFLMMMKQAPRATLIGEKSYGSSGNPKPTHLPNGVTAMIPSWKAMRPDGTTFEGAGVEPDIVVPWEGVALGQKDPVLVKALAVLRASK